jgi:acyl-CoA thioester hydrolase
MNTDAAWMESYRGTVYPWHCDHVGHMNVMWYAGKFDEATWQFFASLGLSPQWLRENHRGMAAIEQRIAYRRELRAGDVVVVRSGVREARDKSIRFVHHMHDAANDDLCAVTELVAVHLDTLERRSCKLPDRIVQSAREGVVAMRLPWDPP